MPNYYCTDEQLTDELPSNLTDTELATSTERTAKLRSPASRWIDAVLPQHGGFCDVSHAISPPDQVIQQACKCYALHLGWRILDRGASSKNAKMYLETAKDLVQYDSRTGRGRLLLSGQYVAMGVATRTRDRRQENLDLQDVVE